ncbi:MAG: VOC family protein [Limosilactobacillus pontis]|uniref:VOC family protein n=1 Tax=Limosilactobacillus pontis TaxID=35787 RepID=A0A2J6NKL4_9LACO|nr:VOC family protein [Limosilactobacillus pontis]PMB81887.1 VOC family protein [Limosilactobacillus pontis]
MTARIYPYLTFKNAKEAMDYYVQAFGATITYHQPFNQEQAESLGMATDDESLQQTTLRGEFTIAGQKVICADATMGTPQSSARVSLMLNFADTSAARQLFDRLAESADQRVTVPFGSWMFDGQMGQVVDKYGITWLITTAADAPQQ